MGVIHETIDGKIFIEQTTYYIYRSEEDLQNDAPFCITSNKEVFDKHKEQVKKGTNTEHS